MKDYQKMNLRFSVFYLIMCLAFSLSYFAMDWQWLTDANYTLHEMLSLPIQIGWIFIPISSIAGLIIYTRYRRHTAKEAKKMIHMLLNNLSLVSLILCITFSYFTGR